MAKARIPMVVAGLVASLALVVVAASPAAAAPAVDATPKTDLVDRQVVDVTGGGFSAGGTVGIVQCVSGLTSTSDCDLGSVVFAEVDASGSVGSSFEVQRIIDTANAEDVDCAAAAGACVIAVGRTDLSEVATVAISFDPDVPPAPELDVDVAFNSTGSVVSKTGVVTITGTLTCSLPAEGSIFVSLRQRAGRAIIQGFGDTFVEDCEGTVPWSVTFSGQNGIFKGGKADIEVFGDAFDGSTFDSSTAAGRVSLRGRR